MEHLSEQLQRAQQYTDQVRRHEVETQLQLNDSATKDRVSIE